MVTDVEKGEARRVTFDPPLKAKYMSTDGAFSGDCLVLNAGEDGALVEHVPPSLDEFFLIFTSAPCQVFRRCKRAWIDGTKIDAEYQRNVRSFARHMKQQ
jgi:hypothetical protein